MIYSFIKNLKDLILYSGLSPPKMSRVHATSSKLRKEGPSSLQHSETCSSHTCSETGSVNSYALAPCSETSSAHTPIGIDRAFQTLGRPVKSRSGSFLFQSGLKPFLTPTLRRSSGRHVQQVPGTPRRPKKLDVYGENVDPLFSYSKVKILVNKI